jgi:hypothetical protein
MGRILHFPLIATQSSGEREIIGLDMEQVSLRTEDCRQELRALFQKS